MRFFDNLIDNFSAKDLRSRVAGVIIAGFVICAIAGAALYYLLIWQQQISISGIGSWSHGEAIVVSLEPDDLAMVEDRDVVRIQLNDPAEGITEMEARVLSINPTSPSMTIEVRGAPDSFRKLKTFDVRIILFEKPLWKMLWGRS